MDAIKMKLKLELILIFVCILSTLSPISAAVINSQDAAPWDTTLWMYGRDVNTTFVGPLGSVTEVESGMTAHMVAKLVAVNCPETATKDQIINLQVQKLDENGVWAEVNYPTFNFYQVTTGNGGKATFHIRTFQMDPGVYRVKGYYAGNENDLDVDIAYKLKKAGSWCGLIIHPPNENQ
jgi:hypothetical protein